MRIILFLGIFCLFVNNLFAGNILSTQEIKSVIEKNLLLTKENIKIEKAEKISKNVVTLNAVLNSKNVNFVVIDVDGQSYMFMAETMLSEKVFQSLPLRLLMLHYYLAVLLFARRITMYLGMQRKVIVRLFV